MGDMEAGMSKHDLRLCEWVVMCPMYHDITGPSSPDSDIEI